MKHEIEMGIFKHGILALFVSCAVLGAFLLAGHHFHILAGLDWDYYQVTHVCHQIDDRTTECHEETWYFKNGERVR